MAIVGVNGDALLFLYSILIQKIHFVSSRFNETLIQTLFTTYILSNAAVYKKKTEIIYANTLNLVHSLFIIFKTHHGTSSVNV